MRFQSGPGKCGSTAIVNALRCYGERVREDVVARHAGTDVRFGTQPGGIDQCLERLGYKTEHIVERSYAEAEKQLLSYLRRGVPVILLVESGEHWTVAVGGLGSKVIVFDGQNYAWNKAENGVHVIETGKNLRRYWDAFEGKRTGIAVLRST